MPGVRRLAFGPIDYALDIGAALDVEAHEEPDSLGYARSVLVVASRAAGAAAPVDGPTTSVRDLTRVAADAERAWARGVLAVAEQAGDGEAFAYADAMVDVPVLQRARAILARRR